jgi:hypothetical protein
MSIIHHPPTNTFFLHANGQLTPLTYQDLILLCVMYGVSWIRLLSIYKLADGLTNTRLRSKYGL